jgi:hypothetical protein
VVETPRPAVQQHDRGLLAHRRAVGHEHRAVDVEPKAYPVHVDVHATPPPPEPEEQRVWREPNLEANPVVGELVASTAEI